MALGGRRYNGGTGRASGLASGSGSVPDYYSMITGAGEQGLNQASKLMGMYQQGQQQGEHETEIGRRDQARTVFGNAWASGDPAQVEAAMQMYPEFAEKAQKMIGIRDEQHRMETGSTAMRLQGLLDAGDLGATEGFLTGKAASLKKDGINVEDVIAKLRNDPDGSYAAKLKNYAKSLGISVLKPNEITSYNTDQQKIAQQDTQIANQYELGKGQLGVSQGQLGLGYAQLAQQKSYQDRALEQGTATERDFKYFNSLSPEDQIQYLAMRSGKAGGGSIMGVQDVQLANGQTVQIDPKVHGSGDKAFYTGKDANGKIINVPINSVASPVSTQEAAGNIGMNSDLGLIANASPDDLDHITGYALGGGLGSTPIGADTYTGYKGGSAREIYSAAKRVQGNMQNKGLAAAKSMGASGINTQAEAKMYFESMPQLDFSSPESLIESGKRIRTYTENYDPHKINYAPPAGGNAPAPAVPSDIEAIMKKHGG